MNLLNDPCGDSGNPRNNFWQFVNASAPFKLSASIQEALDVCVIAKEVLDTDFDCASLGDERETFTINKNEFFSGLYWTFLRDIILSISIS